MKDVLLTSSALILALLVLRRLFRKVLSRRAQYALWGLVLLRLLVPVNLPAAEFSLLTAAEPVVGNLESLYISPGSLSTARQDGGWVWGPPEAPAVAVGPVSPNNTYAFSSQDSRENPVDSEATYQRQIPLEALLPLARYVWYGGMSVMAGWLVLSNLAFWQKLRKSRQPYPVDGAKYPVYLVESGLPSPCLFGLFRPAVYLTPAALASDGSLHHVLAHEETHARHLDPLWSLLRGVCLTVYWFDPLVWWAALASRTDCELACDEGALRRLGEAERIPYGKTLLSLIPVRRVPANPLLSATTMTSGKRRLMDRVTRIAENRKHLGTALFAAVALAALACAVTFTGAKTTGTVRPLTEEELAYFNGEFFTEAHGQGENRRRQFLTCIYGRPEDIDLYEVLYNGTGLPEEITEADLAFVSERYTNGAASDFVKISTASADAFFLENTGISFQDATWGGMGNIHWNAEADAFYYIYLDDEAAAYYQITDTRRNPEPVVFTSGEREGDTVRLHYQGSVYSLAEEGFSDHTGGPSYAGWPSGPLCVTLREKPDGGWLFVSNQWDNASPALSSPDGEPLITISLDGLEPYEPETAEILPYPYDYREMLGGLEDPDHVLGDYGLMFFGNEYEVFAGVQRNVLSSWPQPFWSFRPGETGTYSAFLFRNLLGHDGFCITTDNPASSHYPSRQNSYYYLNEDGQPVLLAQIEGWPEMIDLDGDGEKELVSPARYVGTLCFRRNGKYYQANLDALLKDYWPQDTLFYYDSWNPASRSLAFRAQLNGYAADARLESLDHRILYFTGDSLLVYNDQRMPQNHMLEWFDVDPQLSEDALNLVEEAYQAAGDGYGNWRITNIRSVGSFYFGGEETRLCQAWQVQYEFLAEAPEEDAEGLWGSAGPGYLYYEETGGTRVFLYGEAESELEPGSSRFWTAMTERLYLASAPLTELSGEELFHRLNTYEWTWDLLNSLGALPSGDRNTVLNTLAGELNERGEASWRSTRSYLQDTESSLTPQGREAWTALQAKLTAPSAPEAAQAALEEIMAGTRVNLTLLASQGGGRYDTDPQVGNGPNRAYGFTQDYSWSYAEDPGDMPASSLLLISQSGDVSFHFWPDSSLVLLNRAQGRETLWFRAIPNDPEDVFSTGIFDFMRFWYDEAEYSGLLGEVVVPDRGQSRLEIAQEWVDANLQASLQCTPGSKYACTYDRAVVKLEEDIPEEAFPDWTEGMERFYFSYEEIFVLENDKPSTHSWNWAGNTSWYEGDGAPEGALTRWQIGFLYRAGDGWRCPGTGTGP